MRNLEIIASRSGAAVLFLHHVGKAAALSGQGDAQQAARGSSVWVDEARWGAYLRGMDEKEAKSFGINNDLRRHYIRFGVSKQNYGAPIADRWLERGDGGILLPADSLRYSDSCKPKQTAAAHLNRVEVNNEVPF